jgi:hypothetical protein
MPKTHAKPAENDWERLKREAAQDAPIAHTAADSPYDPNDATAVADYWHRPRSSAAGAGPPPP